MPEQIFTPAAIFGWSDILMAMGYTHAMEEAKRRATNLLARSVLGTIALVHCAFGAGVGIEPWPPHCERD